MNNSSDRETHIITICKELLGEFINVLLGNVWNKIGLSILLFALTMVCTFSPIVGLEGKSMDKSLVWYVFGGILFSISIFLIAIRWKEIKREKRSL